MVDSIDLVPEITDEDIEWVAGLMGLDDIDEPRRAFLMSRSTHDVAACPGSGKTTLIVAKLAILARKWRHRTKGICVLSHTNVAREEIQHRLGSTVVGQRLLGYPHFIDTIHGFVNRFLALPWLNSNGYPSPTIDDAVATAHRRGTLTVQEYEVVDSYLRKKFSSFERLRICGRDLSFDLGGKPFPSGPNAPSFKFAKRAVETSARAGYFCYDEMFVWSRALIDDFPDLPTWLIHRFPLVILDEMQDTSDLQGALLHAVFPRDRQDVVIQRVGDPNQAIFDGPDLEAGQQDPFPDAAPERCLGIPSSRRFGPRIAALASPFAVTPVGTEGLHGVGPKSARDIAADCRHAIFVFPDNNTSGVLDAYGKHVLTAFDDTLLERGVVTAVGAVHQDAPDTPPGHAHHPKTVPHYWSGYTADIARKEPQPRSLVQYIRAAQAAVRDSGELAPGVEKIASGLTRLAGFIGDAGHLKRKPRSHRAVVEALRLAPATLAAYRALIATYLIDWTPLTEETWGAMRDPLSMIVGALCIDVVAIGKGANFLAWPGDDPSLASEPADSPDAAGANIFRVADGDRHIDIHLGSIHSVKGQSHLATMVLSTYWHAHSFKQMLPWLLGTKINQNGAKIHDTKRLQQTYVAMTRPTHLICLAIPRSVFGAANSYEEHAAILAGRGWLVGDVVDGVAVWRG